MQTLASQDSITIINNTSPKEPLSKLHYALLLFKDTLISYQVSNIIVSTSGESNFRSKHFSDISYSFNYFKPFLSLYVGIDFDFIVFGLFVSREEKIRYVYSFPRFNFLTRSCIMRNPFFLSNQKKYNININTFPHICGICSKCVHDIPTILSIYSDVFTSKSAEEKSKSKIFS